MAQFIEWLKGHLDNKTFTTCRWKDKDNQVFEVLWPRADRTSCGTAVDAQERLGIMYAWWVHKFGNSRLDDQATSIKGNFRSCLNSKITNHDMEKLSPSTPRIGGADEWKVYKFLPKRTDKPRQKRQPPDDSSSVVGIDPYKYFPDPQWVDTIIKGELEEVLKGQKTWKVKIEFFNKNKCYHEFTYDYLQYGKGTNTLLFYFNGDTSNSMSQERKNKVRNVIPENEIKKIVPFPVVPPVEDRNYFVNDKSYMDLMCPIMLVEFDESFNIYVRRLCTSYLFHTNTKSFVFSRWEKLPRVTSKEEFNNRDTYRKNVFSYSLFLTYDYAMAKMYRHLQEDIKNVEFDAIPPTFSLTTEEPNIQHGLDACRTQIKITHLPAENNRTYNRQTDGIGYSNDTYSNKKPCQESYPLEQEDPRLQQMYYFPPPQVIQPNQAGVSGYQAVEPDIQADYSGVQTANHGNQMLSPGILTQVDETLQSSGMGPQSFNLQQDDIPNLNQLTRDLYVHEDDL